MTAKDNFIAGLTFCVVAAVLTALFWHDTQLPSHDDEMLYQGTDGRSDIYCNNHGACVHERIQ